MLGCGMHRRPKLAEKAGYNSLLKIKLTTTTTTSAHAVKATAGGWSNDRSACLTSPLNSHTSSARRGGNECHFWYDSARARILDLPVVRKSL